MKAFLDQVVGVNLIGPPEALESAVVYLRTHPAEKKDSLDRELDYTEKRDAVLSVKNRYPDISDVQLHEAMRRADE